MKIEEEITYPAIQNILEDKSLNKDQKVEKLTKMFTDERAAQRAATESNMIDDDGLNARLRNIQLALEALDAEVLDDEDETAATL